LDLYGGTFLTGDKMNKIILMAGIWIVGFGIGLLFAQTHPTDIQIVLYVLFGGAGCAYGIALRRK
jgi:hypothetical protein